MLIRKAWDEMTTDEQRLHNQLTGVCFTDIEDSSFAGEGSFVLTDDSQLPMAYETTEDGEEYVGIYSTDGVTLVASGSVTPYQGRLRIHLSAHLDVHAAFDTFKAGDSITLNGWQSWKPAEGRSEPKRRYLSWRVAERAEVAANAERPSARHS